MKHCDSAIYFAWPCIVTRFTVSLAVAVCAKEDRLFAITHVNFVAVCLVYVISAAYPL